MQGSLAMHKGSLFVGRYEKTAHVAVFDLGGHRLAGGFSFCDEAIGRSSASGLSVDEDRRIWIADEPAGRVRTFTLFGAEVGGLGGSVEAEGAGSDRLGVLGAPVDVAFRGDGDEGTLLVAGGGERRHALSQYDQDGKLLRSLRSEGNPMGRFRALAGVSSLGAFVYAAECGAGRVQVFRDGEFHFLFSVATRKGSFEPTAVAPLADGRMLVTTRGAASALLLVDGSGRLLSQLAEAGSGEGRVENPSDVVIEETGEDCSTRLAVIDRDGERVQVFDLEGRCFGAFLEGGAASTGSQ